jgi:hypothetical protein
VRADEGMQYVSDRASRRVTFAASEGLWALRFPEAAMHTAFVEELQVGGAGGVRGEGGPS